MSEAVNALVEQELEHEAEHFNVRRCIGRLAGLGALGAVGYLGFGVAGVMTTEAHTTLGPHRADIELTADSTLTLDTGAWGSIVLPLDNPTLGLGAHVNLNEYPLEAGEEPGEEPLDEEDLARYANFFADPDSDIEKAKQAVYEHFKAWGMVGAGATMLTGAGLYALLGANRRRELLDNMPNRRTCQAVLASIMLLSLMTPAESRANGPEEPIPANPIFEGTPLEGAHVTGKFLSAFANVYLPQVMGYVRENQEFYETLEANFAAAILDTPLMTPYPNTTTAIYTTDMHCNIGMMQLVGAAAKASQAELAIDGGDLTFGGTEYEDICVRSYARNLNGLPTVIAPGNHDDPLVTGEQLRQNGFTVLNGQPVEVAGVRFIGDNDWRRSALGTPIYQAGPENETAFTSRLTSVACTQPGAIMLVHEQEVPQPALEAGCVTGALTGHSHAERLELTGNQLSGEQLPNYTGGSTGGAAHDSFTYGPLMNTASLAIVEIDSTNRISRIQTVRFNPDNSVEIDQPEHLTVDASKFEQPVRGVR